MKSLLLLLCMLSFAVAEKIEPKLELVSDSSYLITHSFKTDLKREQILDLYFYFDHIKHYIKKWNLDIKLMEQGSTKNRIQLRYNYVIAKLGMDIVRERSDSSVLFHMKNYYRSSKILPEVLESKGGISLEPTSSGFIVHYSQATTMDKKIGKIYSRVIKHETVLHLEDFASYIDTVKIMIKKDPAFATGGGDHLEIQSH